MTKQLLNKKNINMDQRSLSRVSVEVFSSIEDWASKLLLGGGKVKGWTMFCCASFFSVKHRLFNCGSATGTIQIVQMVSNLGNLERSPPSLATGGVFFTCLQKIRVHGMNERNFRGEKHRFSCLCRFRFCFFLDNTKTPVSFQQQHPALQAPKHLLGSPMSIVSLDVRCCVVGICWEMILNFCRKNPNILGPKAHCYSWRKLMENTRKRSPCYPDHSRNRFKKDDESTVATIH